MILAVDPGPTESAWIIHGAPTATTSTSWQGRGFAKSPNADVLDMVRTKAKHGDRADRLVVEMIASYGMPVGREVFETVLWIGRFVEAWNFGSCRDADLLYRTTVKLHLCNSTRAKDGNVRQALIDRFGGKSAIGTKEQPGPLYGVAGDVWAALAVAVTFSDAQSKARAA